jgi:hypothetical protein
MGGVGPREDDPGIFAGGEDIGDRFRIPLGHEPFAYTAFGI